MFRLLDYYTYASIFVYFFVVCCKVPFVWEPRILIPVTSFICAIIKIYIVATHFNRKHACSTIKYMEEMWLCYYFSLKWYEYWHTWHQCGIFINYACTVNIIKTKCLWKKICSYTTSEIKEHQLHRYMHYKGTKNASKNPVWLKPIPFPLHSSGSLMNAS